LQDTRVPGPAPSLLAGRLKLGASLALLAVTLLMTVPVYGGWLSGGSEAAFRLGLPVLWGGLSLAAVRRGSPRPVSALLLSLFGVSLGFAAAYVVGRHPGDWLGLSPNTPQGAAVAKVLSEVIPVSLAMLLAASLAGLSARTLGLRGGRAGASLGLGLLATVPLVVLFALDPSGGRDAVRSTPAATLGAWLPWILLFSLANGFMEELWFRGLWLSAFTPVIGAAAAMHVTSLAFCLLHVIVNAGDPATVALLTPAWLFMGYAYAWVMRRTGSLWGPVLSHAVADVLFLLVAFSTGQM
jgi:membrane protease YdiL (CAAX protease family)